MESDALKAFVAVANSGSFSDAARFLHITQPAVSKRIAALESHLDQSLFDRLGREVRLTEAGEYLLPNAMNILQSIDDTEKRIRERSGRVMGTLRVATSHHIGLHHLPPVLRDFASEHRDVNLQFEFLDSEHANEKIIRGECELAIVTLAPKIEVPLVAEQLWDDPLCFVVGQSHPLAERSTITLATLSKQPAILPDLATYTGRLVKACFDHAELPLQLNMATNYLETIKMMVSVGLGWSVLPKTLIDSQMRILSMDEVRLQRRLGIVKHHRRSLSNAANAFYKTLRKYRN